MTVWAVRVIPQLLPPTPVGQGGLSLAPDWRVVSYAMLLAGDRHGRVHAGAGASRLEAGSAAMAEGR